MTSSDSGRYSRCAAGTPRSRPPRTAGIHPDLPDRAFSHRTAYTSRRAANNAAKKATFALGEESACTAPGAASKIPVCTEPGRTACCGVNSNSRTSLAFSACSRVTWVRNAASSPPSAPESRAGSPPGSVPVDTAPYLRVMTPAIRSRIDQMIEDKPTVDCCNHSEQIRGGLYTPARRCAHRAVRDHRHGTTSIMKSIGI